jgi:hypothetical protein
VCHTTNDVEHTGIGIKVVDGKIMIAPVTPPSETG